MLKKLLQEFESQFVGQSKVWEPVSDSLYYGRMSDKEIEDMNQRFNESIEKCKKEMGEKYILHPSHKVQRLDHECK